MFNIKNILSEKKYNHQLKKLDKKYNSKEMKKLDDYKLSKLKIDKDFNKITNYDYDKETTKIINGDKDPKKLQIDLLEIDKKYNKISELDYIKTLNDIQNKEWYQVYTKYNEEGDDIELMVEYNNTFIKNLERKGFLGSVDEMIEKWLRLWFVSMLDESDINDILERKENEPTIIKGKTNVK